MTRPLCEPMTPIHETSDGFVFDLASGVCRIRNGKVTRFYRHPYGAGFVAESSYVPSGILIPWWMTVYEDTVVFDDADLASVGRALCGNTSRASRVATEEDQDLIQQAKQAREIRLRCYKLWWDEWKLSHE